MKRNTLFILSTLFTLSATAQQSFKIDKNGEVNDARFTALVKQRGYQAISAFDTVFKKPLLIYAIYVKNQKLGIIDISGKEITPPLYEKIDGLDRGITPNLWGFMPNYIVKKDGKFGLINNRGKEIIPATYTRLFNGSGDSVLLTIQGERKVFLNLQGKPINFTDPDSRPSQPYVPEYDQKLNANSTSWHLKNNYKKTEFDVPNLGNPTTVYNGMVIFRDRKGYFGVYNSNLKKLIIPVEYDRVELSPPGMFIVLKGNSYGVIDSLGEIRLPVSYQGISRFTGGALIYQNKKYALYSNTYKPLSDFVYDGYNYAGEVVVLKKDGKYGLLDAKGKIIVPFNYEDMTLYKQSELPRGMLIVTQDKKQGVLDLKGNTVVKPQYEQLIPECVVSGSSNSLFPEPFYSKNRPNRYYFVRNGGKFGLLDNNFQPLLPITYEKLLPAESDGLVAINENKKWGVWDSRTKKMLLPVMFDWKPAVKGYGYVEVIKDRKYGLWSPAGKEIVSPATEDRIDFDSPYKGLLLITDRRARTLSYADHYGHKVIVKTWPQQQ